MVVDALRRVVEGGSLTVDEAEAVMTAVMSGEATPSQLGGLLTALRMKGETADELAGFVRAMRAHAVPVTPTRRPLLDTCGTGGDAADTFNISTTAAFVVAAAGPAVAKHGNRSVSSKCGSADVLAALGVDQSLSPADVGTCIDEVGIGFLFAPNHHPAMRHAAQTRRELALRTVFNALGPMTNPAGARRQLLGVYHPGLCERVAEALARLGTERALVVHGLEGLDEVSVSGPTLVSTLEDGRVVTDELQPEDLGLARCAMGDLAGGDTPQENAAILRAVLEGERGPRRDVTCANAAAGLLVAGAAEDWRSAVRLSGELLDSRRPLQVLERLVAFTRAHAAPESKTR